MWKKHLIDTLQIVKLKIKNMLEVKIPRVGESVQEVTIAKWFKKSGEYVERDEALCELESDKAAMELPAEQAGILEITVEEGADVKIGAVIGKIDTSAKAPDKPAKKEEKVAVSSKQETASNGQKSETRNQKSEVKESVKQEAAAGSSIKKVPSPAAAKIMAEQNISAAKVNGTGKAGRITKQDVLALLANKGIGGEKKSGSRDTRQEKMSRLRRTIATRLVAAKNQTAMLTTFNEVDMSAIMEIRKQYKDKFKELHGVGLGFMSFFAKACCAALEEFPAVNAMIDGDDIIFHDYCDISIAVSTPRGLVVPVIRNTESLSMAEIEKEVIRLATKGRDGALEMEEMEGGTFTITNGGVFGSMMSTPIINQPQSAILGMHKIEERPMAINGEVVVKPMMYLALSYDHRIIDGKESVSFLVKVKELLEKPEGLLVGKDPVKLLLEL